jgi:hypothetical protein
MTQPRVVFLHRSWLSAATYYALLWARDCHQPAARKN